MVCWLSHRRLAECSFCGRRISTPESASKNEHCSGLPARSSGTFAPKDGKDGQIEGGKGVSPCQAGMQMGDRPSQVPWFWHVDRWNGCRPGECGRMGRQVQRVKTPETMQLAVMGNRERAECLVVLSLVHFAPYLIPQTNAPCLWISSLHSGRPNTSSNYRHTVSRTTSRTPASPTSLSASVDFSELSGRRS